MSDVKHTPGPWLVVGDADPEVHAEDGTWIVNQVCSGAGDENDDGMANARLIAAAPDLLAACKAFDLALYAGSRDELIAAAVLARGAISKAEQA
jgi:hypothetical protein